MSYGYHRSEVLGALASIILIWGIIVFLLIEAVHRLINQEEIEINKNIMLITSIAGLVCNLISIFALTYTEPSSIISPKVIPSKNNSRIIE
jgi:Co/Zn/Cd efflux system component